MMSHTACCYPVAKQSVREAIIKDGQGEIKDAYCEYLSCMLFMVKALRDEAIQRNDVDELCFDETSKLFILTEQCLDRARDILKSNHEIRASSPINEHGGKLKDGDDVIKNTLQTPHCALRPPSASPTSSPVSPNRNARRVSEPPGTHYPVTKAHSENLINRLPSPPPSGVRNSSPQSQHREMYQALQRRKIVSGTKNINQKYANTNYNLSLFRQAAEKKALNLAKEKVIQQRWLERQNEIKYEAEKRWNLKKNRSQRDKEYRKSLLAEIIAFEETANWPSEYRKKLKERQQDATVITDIVQAVLKCRDHPLCKVCKGLQYLIYQKVSEVLNQAEVTPNYLEPLDMIQSYSGDSSNRTYNQKEITGNFTNNAIDTSSSKFDEPNLSSLPNNNGSKPVPVPRKSLPSSGNQQSTEKSNDDLQAFTDLKLPEVPESNSADSIDLNKIVTNLQKLDSLEKVYNALGDELFSSDSDEAEDDGDNSTEVATENGDNIFKENDKERKENDYDVPKSNNQRKNTEHSTDEADKYDFDNPLYFTVNVLNIDRQIGDVIPLTDHLKENQETSQYEVLPTAGLTEENKEAPVSISVQSPTSPGVLDTDEMPLLSRYTDDSDDVYSDLNDDFEKEEKYQTLVPSPTLKNTQIKDNDKSSGGDDKVPSLNRESTEADREHGASEHEYYEVEFESIKRENQKNENFNTIEEESYESLDTVEENIYEDLDALTKINDKNDDSSTSVDCGIPSGCNFEDSTREDDLAFVIDTFYLKKLDSIVQELRFGIDRLHTVLLLAYEDLDNLNGRDQSYTALEGILFKPLWPWVFQLFKTMNVYKADYMKDVMEHYKTCLPQNLKIRDKFALLDADNNIGKDPPYQEAIDELKRIKNMISPIDKVECAVRMSKAIHKCVEKYWCGLKGEAKAPTLGCDDLLPIVSFVVVKTNYPQIVSECHAMEEFIRDDYLMGEEGYCLTTLHAAISYLLSLSKNLSKGDA